MTMWEKCVIGFVTLFWLAWGILYIEAAWTVRKYERRLSPLEQHLVMQIRKRRTIRQLRRVVRDHKEGRY